jgi:hypothetical protein
LSERTRLKLLPTTGSSSTTNTLRSALMITSLLKPAWPATRPGFQHGIALAVPGLAIAPIYAAQSMT